MLLGRRTIALTGRNFRYFVARVVGSNAKGRTIHGRSRLKNSRSQLSGKRPTLCLPPTWLPKCFNLVFGKSAAFSANFLTVNFIDECGDRTNTIFHGEFLALSNVLRDDTITFFSNFRDQRSRVFARASAWGGKVDYVPGFF